MKRVLLIFVGFAMLVALVTLIRAAVVIGGGTITGGTIDAASITGAGNLIYSNATAVALAPTITQTNFVSGQLYTNNTGKPIYVQAHTALTVAAIAGAAEMDLKIDQSGGNTFTVVSPAKVTTLITSLVVTDNRMVCGWVANGGVYSFTNTSTGIGNSSSVVAGTGIIVTH
jgi:hypothetical protein